MSDAEIEAFVRDRDEALLSLDEAKIRAYMVKYSIRNIATTDEAFWRAIHKARTGIKNFPADEKQKSKIWLAARGSSHFDGK